MVIGLIHQIVFNSQLMKQKVCLSQK